MAVNTGFDMRVTFSEMKARENEQRIIKFTEVAQRVIETTKSIELLDILEMRSALSPIMADESMKKDLRVVDGLMKMAEQSGDTGDLGRFVWGTLGNHPDMLENAIRSGNLAEKKVAEDTLVHLFAFGVEPRFAYGTRERAAEVLGKFNDDELREMEVYHPGMYLYYTMVAPHRENNSRLTELMDDPASCKRVVKACFDEKNGLALDGNLAIDFGITWLKALGMDERMAEDVVNSWMTIDQADVEAWPKRINKTFIDNLSNLSELTRWIPEAASFLYKEWGITHFGRYPVKLMADQYRNRDNLNQRYGVWVGSYSDTNMAFLERQKGLSRIMVDAAELGYGMRVVEARDKVSVTRRLIDLDRKYGQNNKISFLVIAGHGTESMVRLGTRKGDSLTIADLKNESAKELRKVYKPGLPIVFLSCSTGVEGGIAAEYSDFLGAVAVGPKFISYGELINLRQGTEGKLFFDGRYLDSDDTFHPAAIYREGKNHAIDLAKERDIDIDSRFKYRMTDADQMNKVWESKVSRSYFLERILGIKAMEMLMERFGGGEVYLDVVSLANNGERGLRWIAVDDIGGLVETPLNLRSMRRISRLEGDELPLLVKEDLDKLEKMVYDKRIIEDYRDPAILVAHKNGETMELVGAITMDARSLWPENVAKKRNVE